MDSFERRRWKMIVRESLIILAGLLLLAFVDFVVVNQLWGYLMMKHSIPWNDVEVFLWGKRVFIWHIAFIPLYITFFILLGIAGRSWRMAAVGNLLCASGWEDTLYFFIHLEKIPKELPWLDEVIFIGWTRFFTGTAHVTDSGVALAVLASGILAATLMIFRRKLK